MEWDLFWTIAGQVLLGALVLAVSGLAVSFSVFMIRASTRPKVHTDPAVAETARIRAQAGLPPAEGVPALRARGVKVDGREDIRG